MVANGAGPLITGARALIAGVKTEDAECVIGVARYAASADGESCDFADESTFSALLPYRRGLLPTVRTFVDYLARHLPKYVAS